jgi:NAD+ kinase
MAANEQKLCHMDLIITLGGDGTILGASHIAAPHNIPVLGVHMGRFGFIAETRPDGLFAILPDILNGNFQVEERMMVEGEVHRDNSIVYREFGLNDIVLNKGAHARMLHLGMAFNDENVASYPADGLIVATPTGSTAYSLSAGGPIVEPTIQALLVAPICAHSLGARPILIPPDQTVSVRIESDGGEVLFIADSDRVFSLHTGDKVMIRRSRFCTRLVMAGGPGFYKKIRQRLLWGERLSR